MQVNGNGDILNGIFHIAQHVFMVLAEYAFILRVIQMEKRKGDAARRQLRKSVKAVVAANQVIMDPQSNYSIRSNFLFSFLQLV